MRPPEEDRLREALRARAEEVRISPDALPRIRQRSAERRRPWLAVAGAAVATALAIGAAAVVGNPRRDPGDPGRPVSTEESAVDVLRLPAYFAHDGRLYREFVPVSLAQDSDENRIRAAVELSVRGKAQDPDYASLWPASTTVVGVAIAGKQVTVELAGVGGRPGDLAVQQLVYTVAGSSTYTSIKKADGVRLVVDGDPVPATQAPMTQVQAPVWVIDPAQNEVVGKSFAVYLAGVVADGTVHLRVRDAAGEVVDERDVRLSARSPSLGEARLTMRLATGRYTVEATSGRWTDDHDFTVG
ncbi:GerMN domain-containing protein [Dactylosporangium salmoneum]|uniref:GerMN domain-containing protein n=1 Tax=Dactylosporangium salmoneum TaxID=53361 RepID=A0ABN3I442_9ACTN